MKGWFCHDCTDDIGNNVKGLGEVPKQHKGHGIQKQDSMCKCNVCGRLTGGYREDTMCYDSKCEGRFVLI